MYVSVSYAIDVALWIAESLPVSAFGNSQRIMKNMQGDGDDIFSITYQFNNKKIVLNHQSERLRNVRNIIECKALGSMGFMESMYWGKTWIRSNKKSYKGAEHSDLYKRGTMKNIDNLYHAIIHGDHENPTLERGVNSTLTTILGREASKRNELVTWDELISENKRLEVDYKGLVE